jgi:hypothetical protein
VRITEPEAIDSYAHGSAKRRRDALEVALVEGVVEIADDRLRLHRRTNYRTGRAAVDLGDSVGSSMPSYRTRRGRQPIDS